MTQLLDTCWCGKCNNMYDIKHGEPLLCPDCKSKLEYLCSELFDENTNKVTKRDIHIESLHESNSPKKIIKENNQQPKCPHCGSTAGFTPVRRNWSFLAGFATKKVDLICNNCGKKK